ncbi:chitin deacetylase [Rhizophlyctis rosea]|uniref:Chitin deacetylase n=1 Tax=Rhizophlyctis rosea TaxID=64517 RepID=A0AAD5SL02_9FUNG|nr:chitin deacetylase [Rhizophlyctis rosea]
MVRTAAIAALLIGAASAQIQIPPPIPTRWPENTQLVFITGSYLQEKLVQDAWKHVQTVVRPELLAIKPSTYKQFADITYNDNPQTSGYKARRLQDTADFKADVYTCKGQNDWGLTYDDGPSNVIVGGQHVNDTSAILQRLDSLGVKATFFVCGTAALSQPEILKATYQAGHEIASHTWTHHPITTLTNEQLVAEVKYTEALIYSLTGKVPNQFRPPYGDIDDRCRAILTALGYTTIIWGYQPHRDSLDAGQPAQNPATAKQVVDTIRSWFTPQPGFISLQHDIQQFTASIAITVLDYLVGLKNNNQPFPLNIKTVGQCIEAPYYRDGTSAPGSTPVSTTTTTTVAPTTTAPVPSATVNPDSKQAEDKKNAANVLGTSLGLAGVIALLAGVLPLW